MDTEPEIPAAFARHPDECGDTIPDQQSMTRHGDELFRLVYDELKQRARQEMWRQRRGHTLQPTALINEVYIRLKNKRALRWNGRARFVQIAAWAMRDILVEYARKKAALRRGGDLARVTITVTLADGKDRLCSPIEDLLALDRALEKMQKLYPEEAEVVALRYYGGLTIREIADVEGVATATVERRWKFAKAWLRSRLTDKTNVS